MNNNEYISKPAIEQLIHANQFCPDIIVLDSVDSTNTYAKSLAQKGAKSGTCVIAKTQTGGRGRLGRSFFSPSDTGIYMSILYRPETSVKKNVPLTIAACVAVCKTLEQYSDKKLGIKWVNDIFANGKKVCGILTEGGTMSGSTEIDYYIIGIGINISAPTSGFPDEIRNIAGSISDITTSKNHIIAGIVSKYLELCKKADNEYIINEYKKRCFILGKAVKYIKNAETKIGLAEDINSEGNLIVRLENGDTDTLISGEITLRSENYTR